MKSKVLRINLSSKVLVSGLLTRSKELKGHFNDLVSSRCHGL